VKTEVMNESHILVPDLAFKKELGRMSGSSLNQCMQCGHCSAVCSLAPAERPFPRKEMVWSAWGLKDKLMGNVDVWLCHQCGECSTTCPRGVRPADVIAAIRKKTYLHYARPRFVGQMLSRPALLPLAIALPVVVIIAILSLAGTFSIPEGPVEYSLFFPHGWLNGSFSAITLLFYGLAASGLVTFWKDMKRQFPGPAGARGSGKNFFRVTMEIFTHSSFSRCRSACIRRLAHMLLFFGFFLLVLVTLYAIRATVTGNYPLPLYNPFKIAGNVASLMIYVGLGIMAWQRLFNREVFGRSGYQDWLLLVSVALLTLSGTLVEMARFGNWSIAYHLYFFHLVAVWFVIIYLPFTRMGHILYRTTALVYARSTGRK
jgi:quinone-modifying oxidoreductase, subunit QmoC